MLLSFSEKTTECVKDLFRINFIENTERKKLIRRHFQLISEEIHKFDVIYASYMTEKKTKLF